MIDQRTANLNLPLPHQLNNLDEDVQRVRDAISGIDAAVADRPTEAQVQALIDAILDSAPGALNTLNELAAAMGDDPNFAATVASQIAAVQAASMPIGRIASPTVLGGVKIGENIVVDENGVISVPGAGGGGTQTFVVLDFTPTDGQTVFSVAGGYVPGHVEVLLNGVELMADDYSATNGTTVVLTSGVTETDIVRIRKWSVFDTALVASQAEAEVGVLNAKVMTPLRVAQAFRSLGTQVLSYANRGQLRTLVRQAGSLAMVEGLGVFRFAEGSTELDDDETSFATASGRWLLETLSWDFLSARLLPFFIAVDEVEVGHAALASRILVAKQAWALNSLAATTQTSTDVAVPGAEAGDAVIVTPPNAINLRLTFWGVVTAPGVVTIYLNNIASSTTATWTAGDWTVAVIKQQ